MTKALFEYYKQGLQKLITAAGDENPQVSTLRILQQRLVENLIAPAAADLATVQRAAAHADILESLNHLSIELTGRSFSAFCEAAYDTPTSSATAREALISFADYMLWLTPLLTPEKLTQSTALAMIQERTLAILEHSTPKEKGKLVETLYNAGLISTAAPWITLSHANLRRVHLVEAEIDNVNFAKADMRGANLVGAFLREAELSHTILVGAKLGWSVMGASRLIEAELGGATLTGVDLRKADVHGTHLIMANLKWADLSQADLSGANLLRANLEEAILTTADLSGAVLLWTNFTHARLDGTKLDKATYNQHTLWPEGFDPTASGAVIVA
ncbi:MAG: pentapeptide repeat-containing protein [Anaerolineae bacterium]|nr:pentapeptide repeat-containing protein [Anaerolineae bacterium]